MLNKLKNLFTTQRTNLVVGVLGVSLQLFVLNPWHRKISIQLNSLENKIDKLENDNVKIITNTNINTNIINEEKDINKN